MALTVVADFDILGHSLLSLSLYFIFKQQSATPPRHGTTIVIVRLVVFE